ncbi:MAG: glycosyl hydrolase family 28-related protein [Fimbriimonadaceae bacterium]
MARGPDGSLARTIEYLRDFFALSNVKQTSSVSFVEMPAFYNVVDDFHAYNDGTETSAEIQAAFDALEAPDSGGGVLYFPAGEYFVNKTVNIASNCRMVGDGMRATLFKFVSSGFTGSNGYLATNKSNIEIESIGFSSAGADTAMKIALKLWGRVDENSAKNFRIKNCRFSDLIIPASALVDLDGPSNVEFEGCHFEHFRVGVRNQFQTWVVDNVIFRNCVFRDYIDYGTQCSVLNFGSKGFQHYGCSFFSLDPSGVPGDIFQPLQLSGSKVSANFHEWGLVSACYVAGSGQLHAPTITKGTSDQIAVYNSRAMGVFGNVSVKGGDNGIAPWFSRRMAITGNYCNENLNHGIVGQGVENCNFAGNICSDNGTSGNVRQGGVALTTQYQSPIPGPEIKLSCQSNHIAGNLFKSSGYQDYGIFLYIDNVNGTSIGVRDTSWGLCAFPTGPTLLGEQGSQIPIKAESNIGITGTVPVDPHYRMADSDVILASASDHHALGSAFDLPAGSVVRSVQAIVRKPIAGLSLGGSATRFGIGPTTSEPRKYGQSSGTKITERLLAAPLASGEALTLFAIDNAGVVTGTVGATGQVVRIRIVYEVAPEPLPSYDP